MDKDRLMQRGWRNDSFCALCRRNLETALHLFVEYQQRSVGESALLEQVPQFESCKLEFRTRCSKIQLTITGNATDHSLALLVAWTIRKQRNSRIFSQREKNVRSIFAEIHDQIINWSRAGIRTLSPLGLVRLSHE